MSVKKTVPLYFTGVKSAPGDVFPYSIFMPTVFLGNLHLTFRYYKNYEYWPSTDFQWRYKTYPR